jgi:sulfur relay protein TusB/DsrH
MLFLIASAPDTREFKTAHRLAKDMNAEVCLLQNAVYAAKTLKDSDVYVLIDELQLRGIKESEATGRLIDYGQLIDRMNSSDKVVGLF